MSDSTFEQYKLYVELMDRVSARRQTVNRFYLSLLSVMIAIYPTAGTYVSEANAFQFLSVLSLLGLFLCMLWFIHLRSFRLLNKSKFKVIHEMEKELPFACFDLEWDLMNQGGKGETYILLSKIEQYVSLVFACLFIGLWLFELLK